MRAWIAIGLIACAGCASIAGLDEFGPAKEDPDPTGGSAGTGGTPPDTCLDLMLSPGETDIDCGGPCAPCQLGQTCAAPTDCVTGSCVDMVCVGEGCTNEQEDGDETDVDCGGSCGPCTVGNKCGVDQDCSTLVCQTTCVCNDHVVISEIRTRGPLGGNDDFIELYNPTSEPITLDDGWSVEAANTEQGTANFTERWTGSGEILAPYGHLLLAGSAFTGAVQPDVGNIISIPDSVVVRLVHVGLTVDDVCLCDGDADCQAQFGLGECESLGLPGVSMVQGDLSYERIPGGEAGHCIDTDDYRNDFNTALPANPQNLASPQTPVP